jgi:hypothetical protein
MTGKDRVRHARSHVGPALQPLNGAATGLMAPALRAKVPFIRDMRT